MFAVVRTGGKQYRVHPGDKIVVEKLDGSAGDKITLGDVLLAGDGGDLKSTDGPDRRGGDRRPGQGRQGHRLQEAPPAQLSPQEGPPPAAHDPQDRRDRRPQAEKRKAAKPDAAPEDRRQGSAARPPRSLLRPRRRRPSPSAAAGRATSTGTPTENPAPNNEAAGPIRPAQSADAPPKAAAKADEADRQNPVDKKCCTC